MQELYHVKLKLSYIVNRLEFHNIQCNEIYLRYLFLYIEAKPIYLYISSLENTLFYHTMNAA